jgi:hypothetical protein
MAIGDQAVMHFKGPDPRDLIGKQLAPRYQWLKRAMLGRQRQASCSPQQRGDTMQIMMLRA